MSDKLQFVIEAGYRLRTHPLPRTVLTASHGVECHQRWDPTPHDIVDANVDSHATPILATHPLPRGSTDRFIPISTQLTDPPSLRVAPVDSTPTTPRSSEPAR